MEDLIEKLIEELKVYKNALKKEKNSFGRAIFEFEIDCIKLKIKELENNV